MQFTNISPWQVKKCNKIIIDSKRGNKIIIAYKKSDNQEEIKLWCDLASHRVRIILR